jgi:hypothetical protein
MKRSYSNKKYNNTNNNNNNNRFISNNLNDKHTKKNLIDYIYDTLDISHFKYELLKVQDHLLNIKKNYLISPNYNGTNCLLVFIKLAGKYFSFLLDRKMLSYNKLQVDLEKINLIPVRLRLDTEVYKGTIFDGMILHNKSKNKTIYVINDIYKFRGQNLINVKMEYKEINISTYLNSQMVSDNNMNNIIVVPNKFFKLEDIKSVINTEIEKCPYSENIKGIAFYPETSGVKYIYLYSNKSYTNNNTNNNTNTNTNKHSNTNNNTNTNTNTNTNKHSNTNNNINRETNEQQQADSALVNLPEDGSDATFEIRKTETNDVYKLYLLVKKRIGKKRVIKSRKIDIAYVPTKKCSLLCNTLLKDKNRALVICSYYKKKNKWIPIKKSTEKRPNYIKEVFPS